MAEGNTEIEIEKSPSEPGEKFGNLRRQVESNFPQAESALNRHGFHPTPPEKHGIMQRVRERFRRNQVEAELAEHAKNYNLLKIGSAVELTRKDLERDTDPLTGLLNRSGYEKKLKEIAEREVSSPIPSILLNIDVNRLKWTNDTLGHAAGDKLLQDAADVLRSVLRDTDTIGHISGDEYQAVLRRLQEEHAREVRDRIGEEATARGISMSVGIAPLDPKDIPASIKRSEEDMYVDKDRFYEEHPEIERRK